MKFFLTLTNKSLLEFRNVLNNQTQSLQKSNAPVVLFFNKDCFVCYQEVTYGAKSYYRLALNNPERDQTVSYLINSKSSEEYLSISCHYEVFQSVAKDLNASLKDLPQETKLTISLPKGKDYLQLDLSRGFSKQMFLEGSFSKVELDDKLMNAIGNIAADNFEVFFEVKFASVLWRFLRSCIKYNDEKLRLRINDKGNLVLKDLKESRIFELKQKDVTRSEFADFMNEDRIVLTKDLLQAIDKDYSGICVLVYDDKLFVQCLNDIDEDTQFQSYKQTYVELYELNNL